MGETFPPHGGILLFENRQIRKSLFWNFSPPPSPTPSKIELFLFQYSCCQTHSCPAFFKREVTATLDPSVFGRGASHLHLTGASLAPESWPGFPYFELWEVSPMLLIVAVCEWSLFYKDCVMDSRRYHQKVPQLQWSKDCKSCWLLQWSLWASVPWRLRAWDLRQAWWVPVFLWLGGRRLFHGVPV